MNAQIVLEYIKALLTSQVVAGTVALTIILIFKREIKDLLLRVATIKLPGGTEFSAPQASRIEEDSNQKKLPASASDGPDLKSLLSGTDDSVRAAFEAERARAYLWEYRYLNHFLAFHTQQVLDWLSQIQSPASLSLYDTVWLMAVPSTVERSAIIEALSAHYLIQIQDQLITVTPKGKEYIDWRGPIHRSASNTSKA
jgi:hypothetical protein